MNLKKSSAKWRPFFLGLDVLAPILLYKYGHRTDMYFRKSKPLTSPPLVKLTLESHHWCVSITIPTRGKVHFSHIVILMKWSLQNFAHDTTAALSGRVQTFVAICWPVCELERWEFSLEFELWKTKNISAIVPCQNHYSDVIMGWRLKSPASSLFTQSFIQAQIKENIKAPRHWPLCGGFTGHRWIPHTNGQ